MSAIFRLERLYQLLIVVCLVVFLSSKFWIKKPVIDWDITLYYHYLPALFIYDDLKFEQPVAEWGKRHFYMKTDAEGNQFVKMTAGPAILYSPFFFMAHAYATFTDQYVADGFSEPYRFALLAAALAYALAGLYFLKRFLQHYVSAGIAALSSVLIFAGTNLPHYSFVEPMSHVFSFALVCLILWRFEIYRRKASMKEVIIMALSAGFIILSRPTNIIVLLFPLLLIFIDKPLKGKQWISHPLVAALLIFLAVSPQLFYWKYMTGHWIVYSYTEEGFFFLDPEIWKGLFSYRKGWFVYSPLLFICIPGFYFLFKERKKEALAAMLSLAFAFWVTFSWWCWWYGGSFGARALIEFLPFMALALAFSLQWLLGQKLYLKIPALSLISFLALWSIFMNKQYKSSILHWDSMTKELFWKQFFIDHHIKDHGKYLDPPDYDAALKGAEE
ncbi:MAG: hypothetical protein ACPGVV_00300 [Croceimicrobium sp.]